jgi:arabinan endo-1,5-alpha-L-arabinosidase
MRRAVLAVWLPAALLAACSAVATVAQDKARPKQAEPPGGGGNRPLSVHDPSTIVKHKGEYWTFATGRGVASLRSRDLVHWERGPAVFPEPPKWITDVVPTQRGHFWAPDVIHHDGRYLLYYSVSAFGKRSSAIALASNPTLDPADPAYRWTDHGIVIRTTDASDHNAIDPNLIRCRDGTLWMAYGSFWSGIKLVQLDPKTGLRIAPDSPVHSLAHKEQIEAVTLYERDGYFYQFVNWGWCCRGVKSTYNIRVGRSREVTGPYLDRDGIDLRRGGGSLVLGTEGRFIGPGHAGILKDGDRYWLSYHFYDGEQNGRSRLAIRPLEWAADGWPRVAGPPITPPAPG